MRKRASCLEKEFDSIVEVCGVAAAGSDDGASRKRRNVEHAAVLHVGGSDLRLGALANYVELALEGVFVHAGDAADENLLYVRLGAAGNAANCSGIDGRVPPA